MARRAIAGAKPRGPKVRARANGLEPNAYLLKVFTDLPNATTLHDIEALLPWAKMNEGREA